MVTLFIGSITQNLYYNQSSSLPIGALRIQIEDKLYSCRLAVCHVLLSLTRDHFRQKYRNTKPKIVSIKCIPDEHMQHRNIKQRVSCQLLYIDFDVTAYCNTDYVAAVNFTSIFPMDYIITAIYQPLKWQKRGSLHQEQMNQSQSICRMFQFVAYPSECNQLTSILDFRL